MSPRSHIVNNKMREKAGASGATGIVLDSMSEPTTGAKIAGASQRSAGRMRSALPGLLGAVKYGGPLYESCSVSGLPRLPPEWPPRCYPLPRKPTMESAQEDGHVLRGTILLATDYGEGSEARGARVCDRPSAAERTTESPDAPDGQAKGSRARAGNRLSD